jgi:uncharacterized 2Fe-2S/4Fe-4S cluster protein (DUF4445 family)
MVEKEVNYKQKYFDLWILDFAKYQGLGVSTLCPNKCTCGYCPEFLKPKKQA